MRAERFVERDGVRVFYEARPRGADRRDAVIVLCSAALMGAFALKRVYGRDPELRRIQGLLQRGRGGESAALVVRGEPGIGKTTLLAAADALTEGMRTLRARGVEWEAALAYGGLVELLRPVESSVGALPAELGEVLSAALGLTSAVQASPLRVGVALLHLLAGLAEERPVVVLVDDLHWLDQATLAALLFAARRLGAEGVVMILAVREGESAVTEASGLDELVLDGIDQEAAATVIRATAGIDVPHEVCNRLWTAMRGNPLALIEGVSLLEAAELTGRVPLPELPSPGERIERGFLHRLSGLPAPGRRALTLAAAADGANLSELAAALGELGLSLTDLQDPEARGIVRLHADRVQFSHPVLRTVAYHAAVPAERRAAHLALARALAARSPARSILHRAAAATGPDESLARALEEAAEQTAERGGPREAGQILDRAAQLTSDSGARAQRLLAACRNATIGADFGYAGELAARGLLEAGTSATRAALELQRGIVEISVGNPRVAEDQLVEAAGRTEGRHPEIAVMMLQAASSAAVMQGACRRALETAERTAALAGPLGGMAALAADVALARARVLLGAGAGAAAHLQRLDLLLRDPSTRPARAQLPYVTLGQQLGWVECHDAAAASLRGEIAAARADVAPMLLPYLLAALAEVELWRGALLGAYASASDATQLARDTQQQSHLAFALVTAARAEALLGREDECRSHVEEVRGIAQARELGSLLAYAGSVLGLLELSRGDPEAAVRALAPVSELTVADGVEAPNVVPWQPDLIEAHIRCGQRPEAERELESFDRRARETGGTWAAAAVLRCRALLASDGEFDTRFDQALALHAQQSLPLERARTELCYGERLRRAGRRRAAREPLHRALEAFDRAGARNWGAIAEAELLAAGQRPFGRAPTAGLELTARELQAARAIAAGATNAEAAAQLFLSTKTIEKHLSSAYRKLGVRSRTQLAARLATMTGQE